MHIHYVQLETVGGLGDSFGVVTQFPPWRTGAAGPANSEIIYAL